MEKLPGVLWTYRITNCVPTGETPFSLAYETEVIILVDISMSTLRIGVVPDQNDALLRLMLDHSEEMRQQAQVYIAAYQQQIRSAQHKKVSLGNSKSET